MLGIIPEISFFLSLLKNTLRYIFIIFFFFNRLIFIWFYYFRIYFIILVKSLWKKKKREGEIFLILQTNRSKFYTFKKAIILINLARCIVVRNKCWRTLKHLLNDGNTVMFVSIFFIYLNWGTEKEEIKY